VTRCKAVTRHTLPKEPASCIAHHPRTISSISSRASSSLCIGSCLRGDQVAQHWQLRTYAPNSGFPKTTGPLPALLVKRRTVPFAATRATLTALSSGAVLPASSQQCASSRMLNKARLWLKGMSSSSMACSKRMGQPMPAMRVSVSKRVRRDRSRKVRRAGIGLRGWPPVSLKTSKRARLRTANSGRNRPTL
jgi:hypothetical protein